MRLWPTLPQPLWHAAGSSALCAAVGPALIHRTHSHLRPRPIMRPASFVAAALLLAVALSAQGCGAPRAEAEHWAALAALTGGRARWIGRGLAREVRGVVHHSAAARWRGRWQPWREERCLQMGRAGP